MKFSDKISMAFKDLMNRKVRSILTVLAVSIGSLLLIVMMGLSDGIINKLKEVIDGAGDTNIIQVYPINDAKVKEDNGISIQVSDVDSQEEKESKEVEDASFKKISKDDIESIKNIDGVDRISAYVQGNITDIMLDDKKFSGNIVLTGYDFNNDIDISDKLLCGTILKEESEDIIISEDLVSKLGISNNEDVLNKKIKVQAEFPEMNGIKIKEPKVIEGTVVGVANKNNISNTVIMSEKKADCLFAYFTDKENYIDENGYSMLSVYGKEGQEISALAAKITSDYGYTTFSLDMINKTFDALGGVVKAVLSIAGIIVLVVASLGLVNTVSMTLQEKRKMIGVMRSVGGSRKNIKSIFTYQSFIIGLFGGILGSITSAIGIFIANEYITKSSNFAITLTTNNIMLSLFITVIMSIIAGAIPARKAAKINVVEAVAEE
ncbi:MAG: ABC transporter permease [Clostridium sp.]|uniref:ABC transporter permease n=1 Tax=Clostridium sp. DSM 8431 TaxID=1761781 RepID=UPI0008E4D22C|nr:FtsX-like permease family protein [Clostridium sp. DSM 8431]MCR4944464.1 ABC transporter permease [Clostridium sp.]SFU57724.1 putative ABC transport system permease protein [Clostridium sp. DSM 8431]